MPRRGTSAPSGEYAPFRRRTDVNVGSSPICYDGVFNWLFAAGFIPRRWLGGVNVHAATIHENIGDGQIVSPSEWGKIERGWIWNIHKKTSRDTCHWGVSLGEGRAAGCNNTGQGKVDYEDVGPDAYGVFDFVQLCSKITDESFNIDIYGQRRYGFDGKGTATERLHFETEPGKIIEILDQDGRLTML